jgi:peptide/nickel transport system substrate-binding protein
LKDDPNVQLIASPPYRLLGHFNYQIPPFNDPVHGRDLRRALVMAYDNEKALLAAAGTQDRINLCASLTQCGTSWENNAGSENMYNARRVEDAKKIVKDAGYEGYTIRLMDPADRQPAHGAAQVTREVLEDIGFKVDFRVMDWATMVQDRATKDRWEFFHTWSGQSVRLGPIGHLRFGELQYDAWFNHYTDTDGTQRELFDVFARESDPAKIDEAMTAFQQYFYDDAIFLQVGEFFSNWAASNQVEGLHGGAGGQTPYDKWFK